MEQKCTYSYKPHFMLIPSLSCPASCRYCFGPNTGPAMDEDMIANVLDFIQSIAAETGQGKVRCTLHGGEPLAAGHNVIEALIRGLHYRFSPTGLDIGVQSNLWLLDEHFCKLFKRYGVSVSTSLDGPEEINDIQRGNSSFEMTNAGIKLGRSYGLHISCIATFTSGSCARWKEIFDFFLSRGIPFSVHPSVAAVGRVTGLELTPDQYGTLLHEMFESYVRNRKRIKIDSYDQICKGVACNEGRVCTFRDCFGMFLAIDPYGDIYSCQRFAGKREYRLGNISDRPSMADLVDSAAGRRFLEREAAIRESCGGCEHYGYCRGGCAYNAIAGNGSLETVDPYCEAYKRIFLMVRNRLCEEMISDQNIKAISELGPAERGNLLLRAGPVTELTDEHAHPYVVANTAHMIVAAYELARTRDIKDAAVNLVKMGVFGSNEAAETALNTLKNNMLPTDRLNKLYIHATWKCQLECSHCYASATGDHKDEEMDAYDIITMAKDAVGCNFQEVVITGGEPLFLHNREKLLKGLAGIRPGIKPVKLVLRTNFAMPLTPDDLVLLATAFDEIVVSVDGGKEEHDRRRGKGSYEKTVRNMETYMSLLGQSFPDNKGRMRPARLSISAAMRSDEVNSQRGYAVKELGWRLDIRHVKFRPLLPLGRALDGDEPVSPEALRSYLSPLELLKEGYKPAHTCGIGQNLYVEPSGEAFPCYAYHKPHSFIGNVIKEGLKAVIESQGFRSLQEYTVDSNYRCRTCEYRYLCGGACRAWSREAAQDDLNAAPVDCEGLRSRAQKLYEEALRYIMDQA